MLAIQSIRVSTSGIYKSVICKIANYNSVCTLDGYCEFVFVSLGAACKLTMMHFQDALNSEESMLTEPDFHRTIE